MRAEGAEQLVEVQCVATWRQRGSGRSLLVLPFEYSHCLRIDDVGVEQLIPVNIAQTGVVIRGALRSTPPIGTGWLLARLVGGLICSALKL
jgi:hypothetical protein